MITAEGRLEGETEEEFAKKKELYRISQLSPRQQEAEKQQLAEDKEKQKALEILKNKNLFHIITVKEMDKKIVGEIPTRQTIFLCAIGALCVEDASLAAYNALINSKSGAGKDHVTKNALKIIPENKIVTRSRISPTAFTYWHNSRYEPTWTWDGKICYLSDISNTILNHEVFKVMCTEGSTATVTVNNQAIDITINGKPALFITTASAMPNDEMLRRFPAIELDETINQTEAIMQREAEYAEKGLNTDYDPTIKKALCLLKRVKVRIPFAQKLRIAFPPKHMIMRTHFSRLLSYIKASTALHQYQRNYDSEGYLLAEPEDYDIARIALEKTTSNPFMIPLTTFDKRIIAVTKKESQFSVADIIHRITFMSEKSLYVHLSKLADIGFFEVDKLKSERSDKPITVYRPISFSISIPTWKEICGNSTIASDTTNTSLTTITSNTKAIEAIEPFEALKGLTDSATLDKFRALFVENIPMSIEAVQTNLAEATDEWIENAKNKGDIIERPAGWLMPS